MKDSYGDLNGIGQFIIAILSTLILLVITGLFMWVMPNYSVWSKEMRGKADLAEAEYNRQIILKEAEMNLEAEKLNAQSEVERAKGMAEAIKIEGGNLTPEYIQYLWIRHINETDNSIIYIPTEGNLPILEAGKGR